MKAIKKPIEIDYFDPDYGNQDSLHQLILWVKSFGDKFKDHFDTENHEKYSVIIRVKTLEGTSYVISDKDIIIRGVKGEYYPCKKDIFEQTYDKIDE